MRPFFFGGDPLLFGLHHSPIGAARGVGVVIAPPLPQEAMRTAWALRRLAGLLAQEGFHALRFDYRGTGDSAGDLTLASLTAWSADVVRAVTELRELSEGLPIAVLGVRLGGGLALQAEGLSLREIVLWEPVLCGSAHLESLRRLHRQRHGTVEASELLGFPWPAPLAAELSRFDATGGARSPTRRISVLENRPGDGADLRVSGVQSVPVAERAVAQNHRDLNTSLLAPGALRAIADQLAWPLP